MHAATPPPSRRSSLLVSGLACAVATAAILGCMARPTTAPLDEDEIYWLGSAYYYHLALARGDWRHPDWQLLPARENPPVAKFLLGMGAAVAGQGVTSIDLLGYFYLMFERVPGAWGSGPDHAKRSAVVQRMTPALRDAFRRGEDAQIDPRLIVAGRWTVIGCAALMSLMLFVGCAQACRPPLAVLASVLVLLHPAVVYAYNHAVSDIIALMFSAAAVAGVIALAEQWHVEPAPAGRAFSARVFVTAILLALACGAKMNALIVVFLAAALGAMAMIKRWPRDRMAAWRCGARLVLVLGVATGVFIAINPTLLGDLRGGLVAVVEEHRLTERVQAAFLRDHLNSLPQKFAAVAALTFFSPVALLLVLGLAIAALWSPRLPLRAAGVWFLLAVVCVTVWIPFPRSRYVLPVVLPGAVLLGLWLDRFAGFCLRAARRPA